MWPHANALDRSAREPRVRRKILALAVGVSAAAAAGGAVWTLTPLARDRARSTGPSELPDVVRVLCDGSGTHVLTPEVRPQADGLHIRADDRLGERLSIVIRNGTDDAIGLGAEPGLSEVTGPGARGGWPVPPGAASFRCVRHGEDPGDPEGWVPVRIIDEDGLYVPSELGCEETVVGYLDHAASAGGEVGDPVQAVRETLPGLRENDVVDLAGYQEVGTEALVRVMRADRIIATVHLSRTADGAWLPDRIVRCSDAGLGG